ncbi:MAG: thiamine pyrophosphate-binding protein [Mycobacteriales bacterium]
MLTGAEALVQALRALHVEVAFGLPGAQNLAAWEALLPGSGPDSGVRLVGVRHPQTAGYAADGYARATGRLGVALTTTGPGAADIAAATGEAWACHTPLLVLATDIPTTLRRPGRYCGLQETTDQASSFCPVTKTVVRVERAEELYEHVVLAGRAALRAPRRPVYVEIPTDLLTAAVPEPVEVFTAEPAVFVRYVSDAVLQEVAAAHRPLLWAGGGATASSAAPAVTALAERLGAPVLTSYGGRGLLPPEHPHLVPLPPHAPAAAALWDAADLVLVLGSDLDAMSTQAPRPPRLVTVDVVEPIDVPPDHWVSGDVGRVLQELLGLLPEASRPRWFDRPAGRPRSHGSAFLDAFESGLTDDAVVVADLCVAGDWYGDFGRVGQPRGLAYPVSWGTLGFGFPAALGSCLSGRPTVALVGTGGFLSACGDLATAAQEHLPVTVVVVDDGTETGPSDLVALAGAFRVPASEVNGEQLALAMADGIASRQPNLIVLPARLDPPPGASRAW